MKAFNTGLYPIFINDGFLGEITKDNGVNIYKSRAVILIHEVIHIAGIGDKDEKFKNSADLTQTILDACVGGGYKRKDLAIDAQ